jgi:hypothetical protein
MATKVAVLHYDMHNQDGINAYQTWLNDTVPSPYNIISVWYDENQRIQVVIYDDTPPSP